MADDAAEPLWPSRRSRDARLLCVRTTESVVHSRVRRVLLAGFGLWISARGMAVRTGRRHLGDRRASPLAYGA